jgi:hypothetical protein
MPLPHKAGLWGLFIRVSALSEYRLLSEFQRIFQGREYRHRAHNQRDRVAIELYEDLFALNRSEKFRQAVSTQQRVVNVENVRRGIQARRGDGTFGEIVPRALARVEEGFSVARGPVATVEIGCEVKILAKAMIKQIGRVTSDLLHQVQQFKRGGGNPIFIGIVGINSASVCTGYEGTRSFTTTGHSGEPHPCQEAPEAERRLLAEARRVYDEFLILRYRATNAPPFPFDWIDHAATEADYGAILTRILREYDRRF